MKKTSGKKLLAMLLALVLCMSLLPTAVFAEGEETVIEAPLEPQGTGNVAKIGATEYSDLAEALNACQSGQTVELLSDVDLTGTTWTPVAGFSGTFDGKGFTITGLTVTGTGSLGLFANIGAQAGEEDAIVSNLVIDGATITGTESGQKVGVVTAYSYGNISNVTVKNATVTSSGKYVGGIVGMLDGSLDNCTVTGCAISGKDQVGGAIGYVRCGGIRNSTVTGNTVTASEERAGGLVGKLVADPDNSDQFFIVKNTVSGTAICTNDKAGGLAAEIGGYDSRSSGQEGQFTTSYEIRFNDIDVALTGAKTSPIGVLRSDSCEHFNKLMESCITGNSWTKATCADNSITYTAEETHTDAQVINNTVREAKIGTTMYNTLAEAIGAANDGDTIRLLADVALTTGQTITKSITIDGTKEDGVRKITYTGSGNSMFWYNGKGAVFSLKNCEIDNDANGLYGLIDVGSNSTGKIVISNCTFPHDEEGSAGAIVTHDAGPNGDQVAVEFTNNVVNEFFSSVFPYTREGSVFTDNQFNSIGKARVLSPMTNDGSTAAIVVTGNTFVGCTKNGAICLNLTNATTTLRISGNTFTQCSNALLVETEAVLTADSEITNATGGAIIVDNNGDDTKGHLTISGGSYSGSAAAYSVENSGSLTISGGKFSSQPAENDVAEGYKAIQSATLWTVVKDQGSVIVNDNNENNTASVTTDTDSGVDEKKLAEVVTDPVVQNAIKTNTVVSGVELTVPTTEAPTGSGLQQVIAAAAAEDENVKAAIESPDDKDINVTVDVIVTPVAYMAPEAGKENSGSVLFELNPVARVTVKAGDLKAEATVPVDNDMIDQTKPITVSIYTGFKPAQIIHKDDNGGIIETFEGESIGFNGGVATVTIHHFSALLALPNVNAAQIVRNDEPVYFATLEAAIDDAKANETITMLKDVTLTDALCINKAVTIDLGGKNLLSADEKQFYVGNDVSVTVKNGTIDGSIQNGDLTACLLKQAFGFGAYSTGSLTLDNVVFTDEMDSVVSNASTGTLTLKSCTVPQSVTNKIGKLVVSDTKIGTVGTVGAAAALGVEKGEAEISGGSFGKVTVMKDAKLTVTGGTYSQDVTDYCAEHYYCKKATDTTYTVQKKETNTVTVTCADIVSGETPDPQATATYGEATFTYSKDNENWDTWENTYDGVSTYYVKAEVAEGDTYLAGEATTAFAVEYACQSDVIVKFNELVPGEYKMYINGADTGVYKFTMVAGGYTIQDTETGEYVCFDNGSIVMRATNPTAWTKDTAAFHVSVIVTTRYWFFGWRYSTNVTKYYLNAAADGTIVVSKVAGVTHFADHYAAEAHDYKYTCNQNGTHTKYCAGCGEVFGTEKCDYDSTTHLCKYCGYYDPACVTVSCQVNVKKTTNSGVLARLLYGKYTYTATITTSCTGSQITSVQYSLDGKTYTTGTSYRAGKNITKLYVKVTTSAGTQSLWLYDSGKTSQIG